MKNISFSTTLSKEKRFVKFISNFIYAQVKNYYI